MRILGQLAMISKFNSDTTTRMIISVVLPHRRKAPNVDYNYQALRKNGWLHSHIEPTI
jgi:hypothetical protein